MTGLYSIILFLCALVCGSDAASEYCKPNKQNVDRSELPPFPDEFETRILMTNDRKETTDVLMLYDKYQQKAELIVQQNGLELRRIYSFPTNEVIILRGDFCGVELLNETQDSFYSFINIVNNIAIMNAAKDVFHFNSQVFPIEKLSQTTKRSQPVNHYQSCQTWKGNFLIDFYFQLAEYTQGICFDNTYKQVLVEMDISGFVDDGAGGEQAFTNTYSFFEFRSRIEHRSDLFTLPKGARCSRKQPSQKPIPKIPSDFEFARDTNYVLGSFMAKQYYSSSINAFRYDTPKMAETKQQRYKSIMDFNSGVGYFINRDSGTCGFAPIDSERSLQTSKDVNTEYGTMLALKSSNEMFFLNEESRFSGQRYERGVVCDVFSSTSLKFAMQNEYIVETYMRTNRSDRVQNALNADVDIPISMHYYLKSNKQNTFMDQIFGFNPRFDPTFTHLMDISQCFKKQDKTNFGIRFTYTEDMFSDQTREQFERDHQLTALFNQMVGKAWSNLQVSPLRLISPKAVGDEKGFTVFSGVTSSAPAIHHFKISDQLEKIDYTRAGLTRMVSSPDKCASSCLLNEKIEGMTMDMKLRCMSFEYCPMSGDGFGFMCVFNDASVRVNASLVVVDEKFQGCSHYEKVVEKRDVETVERLFNGLEEMVLRNKKQESEIVLRTYNNKEIRFAEVTIFRTEEYANSESNSDASTTFSQQFELAGNYEFNAEKLEVRQGILRQKIGISYDECCRLCLQEQEFPCLTLTYSSSFRACKWSSLDAYALDLTTEFDLQPSVTLLRKNLVASYIKYEAQVTTSTDYKVLEASSPNDCANKCNKEKDFTCRSFNLCENDQKFKCLLSRTNIHSNTNVTGAQSCSHYSKNGLSDFGLVRNTELGLVPQSRLFNVTAETCAEQCVNEDSYLCRSFVFYFDRNECLMYLENLADEINTDLKMVGNEFANFYSRLYYEKDGQVLLVEALESNEAGVKYGPGTMVLVVISMLIAGVLLGILGAFVYLKINAENGQGVSLPAMKFVNPNYERQIDEEVIE